MNGMKFAFFGVAVALFGLVNLAAYAQAPAGGESNGAPAAQSKPDAAATEFCECVSRGDAIATKKIELVLAGPLHSTGFDWTDQPLTDVLTTIQDEYEIPIQLDKPALEEAGLATDSPVNTSLHNLSLRSALKLLLRPLNLTWVVENEVLLITTDEEAKKHVSTCVYNVHGLVDDSDPQSMKALIEAIEDCVAPDTWTANGGKHADIMPLRPGLLVVSQTPAIQEEVNGLLARIRKLREQVPVTQGKMRAPEPARNHPAPSASTPAPAPSAPPAPTPAEPPKKSASQPSPDPGPAAEDPFGA
jgi:hypothetical protein